MVLLSEESIEAELEPLSVLLSPPKLCSLLSESPDVPVVTLVVVNPAALASALNCAEICWDLCSDSLVDQTEVISLSISLKMSSRSSSRKKSRSSPNHKS